MSATSTAPTALSLTSSAWVDFIQKNTDATPFHHPAWATLLAHTYRYRAFALAVCDDEGRPVAGAPFLEVRTPSGRKRWVSLPFTDECPPLSTSEAHRHELTARLAVTQECLRAPRIDVRARIDTLGWSSETDAVIHELNLEAGIDEVHAGFSRSQVVRNIKRATREGVAVRRAVGLDDLESFYRLHLRTRRRQGVPVQPRRFFEVLWRDLVQPGLASILLADVGDARAVAGALFLSWNGTTIYKFGASDPEALTHRPNHLIFSTAIQEACARGDRCFDFGRTDLGNDGLRAFKASWGGRERPLTYSALEPGAAQGTEGLVTRAMGAAIRRGPQWVCRGAGATLYRYAGSR